MSVLQRKQLEESPLADLHALAAELGIEGYRGLRRDDLIGALLGAGGGAAEPANGAAGPDAGGAEELSGARRDSSEGGSRSRTPRPRTRKPRERRPSGWAATRGGSSAEPEPPPAAETTPGADGDDDAAAEVRSGVLHVLGNGSGFMRADAFRQADEDAYVSPAQIRRCELRSGDEISGPVRPPRRSERHPSLVRIDTVNGAPSEPPAQRPWFDDLSPLYATERLAAPDGVPPFGRGSRVVVSGPPGAGATTLLRQVAGAVSGEGLELVVVLAGVRPEEVSDWRTATDAPVVGGSFESSAEERAQAAEVVLERAKRRVERGEHAAIVVDGLDALPDGLARRLFGAARRAEEGGSLTVIASARPGELEHWATTTVLLDPRPDGAGERLAFSPGSRTLRADLLA